jgi:hypothetical protein
MMTKPRKAHDGTPADRRRKHRRRATPRWLKSAPDLDAIARSRCLMVLSVLSGETTVTDAIAQAKISRQTYYHMETKALRAILVALNPLASSSQNGSPDLSAAMARIEGLQEQVKRLEQEKRRSQRLLLLTRKSMRSPVSTGRRGRAPKNSLGSILSGSTRSRRSKAKASSNASSTPTSAGETTR